MCSPEYTITMYDTKTRELRWNATYFDYAASLPEDDVDYSECRGFARGVGLVTQEEKVAPEEKLGFLLRPPGPRFWTSWTWSKFFSSQC